VWGVDEFGIVDILGAIEVGEDSNNVTKEKCQNNIAVLHEDATEQFDKDEEAKDREAKTNVLGSSVEFTGLPIGTGWEGWPKANFLRGNLRMGLPSHFGTDDATTPVLHSSSGQRGSNKNDSNGGDNRRKDGLEFLGGQEGKKEFEQTANHGSSEHGAIGDTSVDSVVFHLTNGNLVNG